MKISIFTPCQDSTYILEAYDSLLKQTHSNWEWVILINGEDSDMVNFHINYNISDERVKTYITDHSGNIGRLKKEAVDNCTGDYVVELDHDDLLTPPALELIVNKAKETDADFIYSDFCEFREDWSCNVYGSAYGWKNYEFEYDGKQLIAMRATEVSPPRFI